MRNVNGHKNNEITPAPHGHTYLFVPGRWGGKGKLSIIGGPTEPIDLKMIISHSGAGTITAHLEVHFNNGREGGVELVYTIDVDEDQDSFKFVQYNSQLGELSGEGATTDDTILLSYRSDDGAYGGFEALERVNETHYRLRSTLSLNGMPSSVMEAAFRRLPNSVN